MGLRGDQGRASRGRAAKAAARAALAAGLARPGGARRARGRPRHPRPRAARPDRAVSARGDDLGGGQDQPGPGQRGLQARRVTGPVGPDRDQKPAPAKLRGAGSITTTWLLRISATARPRSLVPSARSRKMPVTPTKPAPCVSPRAPAGRRPTGPARRWRRCRHRPGPRSDAAAAIGGLIARLELGIKVGIGQREPAALHAGQRQRGGRNVPAGQADELGGVAVEPVVDQKLAEQAAARPRCRRSGTARWRRCSRAVDDAGRGRTRRFARIHTRRRPPTDPPAAATPRWIAALPNSPGDVACHARS
jgi:hypothetical protein